MEIAHPTSEVEDVATFDCALTTSTAARSHDASASLPAASGTMSDGRRRLAVVPASVGGGARGGVLLAAAAGCLRVACRCTPPGRGTPFNQFDASRRRWDARRPRPVLAEGLIECFFTGFNLFTVCTAWENSQQAIRLIANDKMDDTDTRS